MTAVDTSPNGLHRDVLLAAILGYLAGEDLLSVSDVRAALERDIDDAGPQALLALKTRLVVDHGWNYYAPDPLARRIHHRLADRFLERDSRMVGAQHLANLTAQPVAIVANHLSYADANVIETLLQRGGGTALADRLTAVAGPKVFTSRERRFSSLCFGTVKVPQSAEVASGEAVLSGRAVAQAARQAIDAARQRLREGDALLLFGEGTRSRSAEMQPMLAGVARYLDVPGTWILPVGLTGPEALFPVEGSTPRPARVQMHVGRALRAGDVVARAGGDRRIVMDTIGLAIAELLPLSYQGVYRTAGDYPEARDVLREAQRSAAAAGAE